MNRAFQFFRLSIILLILSSLFSCAGDGSSGSSAPGILYVLDDVNDAVYAFNDIANLNGTLSPARTISGSNTLISNPTALAIDDARDILYVADTTQGNILRFSPASTLSGDPAPLKKFPGVTTAGAMFYEDANDRLYVSDITNNQIVVWDNMSTLPNGTSPTRTIPLGFTPGGFAVDTVRDLLYVGNPASSVEAVNVYNGASSISSVTTVNPSRSITDSTQSFKLLNSLSMNSPTNILYVAESFYPSVEIFANVSTLSNAQAASRELQGSSTTINSNLKQISYLRNFLYLITNNTTFATWDNPNQVSGNTAPTRNATLSSTSRIVSFDIDFAH